MPRNSEIGGEENRRRDHIEQGSSKDPSGDTGEEVAKPDSDRSERSEERVTSPITSRRSFVTGVAATATGLSLTSGLATADPPDHARDDDNPGRGNGGDDEEENEDNDEEFPEEGWKPSGIDPEDLTDKSRGELVAAIPPQFKRAIGRADLFSPMSVLEAQQNNTKPAEDENGIVLYEAVDDGADMEYTLRVNDAENGDLNDLTQGHIHHAPRGESDNRMFFPLFIESDLDGSDGSPEDPPLSVSKTLTEALEDALAFEGDNGFQQADPAVPFDDEEVTEENASEFVAALTEDMLDNPTEYINNAHTVEFQTEAIRGQVRRAKLGDLSKGELVEVVLATAGLSAL